MEEKIISFISEVSGYSKELINLKTLIRETGINSMTLFKVIIKIEKEYSIQIDDEDLDIYKIATIMDLINIVNKKINT